MMFDVQDRRAPALSTPRGVLGLERAVDYVMNGQDAPIPELDPRRCLK